MNAVLKLRSLWARGKPVRAKSNKLGSNKIGASQRAASLDLAGGTFARQAARSSDDVAQLGGKAAADYSARSVEGAALERQRFAVAQAAQGSQGSQAAQGHQGPQGVAPGYGAGDHQPGDPYAKGYHTDHQNTYGEGGPYHDNAAGLGHGFIHADMRGDMAEGGAVPPAATDGGHDDGGYDKADPMKMGQNHEDEEPIAQTGRKHDDPNHPDKDILLRAEMAEREPGGIETILFKQLPRPRLTEQSAVDLTVADARAYAAQSKRFFAFEFPLFSPGDLFYEEVEQAFLHKALGRDSHSVDQRFLDVMTLFRLTLNENTRAMLTFWTPLVFLVSLIGGAWFSLSGASASLVGAPLAAIFEQLGAPGEYGVLMGQALGFIAVSLTGLIAVYLLYAWPFKVVQQRNLMNLDNYITSKFSRINHNFQVAKRRAFNVERDKRMAEREDLKEEAAAWTLSYQWFALRLFLCELTIRNKFYQIRRNTVLYWLGTILLCCALLGTCLLVAWTFSVPLGALLGLGLGGAVFIVVAASFLWRISAMMFRVVESHEWNRFHLIGLDQAISDHAGEDKVQIVTFRDRNRFE